MLAAKRIARSLGGLRASTTDGLRHLRRAGLPYGAFEAAAAGFEIPSRVLAAVLDLPPRTLARRRKERRFRADESDRLLRFGRVAALAEEVLGSREKAGRWLRRPNRALGGDAPLARLDSDLGAREAETVLVRIGHGIHS